MTHTVTNHTFRLFVQQVFTIFWSNVFQYFVTIYNWECSHNQDMLLRRRPFKGLDKDSILALVVPRPAE